MNVSYVNLRKYPENAEFTMKSVMVCLRQSLTYYGVVQSTEEGDFVPCSDIHPGCRKPSHFDFYEAVSDDLVHISEKVLVLLGSENLAVPHSATHRRINVSPERSDQASFVPQRKSVRCELTHGNPK